uniref:Uncharacterized protein n=1 Tax=Myotis myotis TaxID=51298 RepID=A0A7J7Z5G9_MYOMY|nr:hypothetical protein mMyoMyo1_010784 [Myotis myotis]
MNERKQAASPCTSQAQSGKEEPYQLFSRKGFYARSWLKRNWKATKGALRSAETALPRTRRPEAATTASAGDRVAKVGPLEPRSLEEMPQALEARLGQEAAPRRHGLLPLELAGWSLRASQATEEGVQLVLRGEESLKLGPSATAACRAQK